MKVFSQYHHGNQAILLKYIKKAEYSSARRHQHQYFLPQTNTDHCRRSYFIRISKEWNVLPTRAHYSVQHQRNQVMLTPQNLMPTSERSMDYDEKGF